MAKWRKRSKGEETLNRAFILFACVACTLCLLGVVSYPLLTVNVVAFVLVSVLLAQLAWAGFRLITKNPLRKLSIEELRKIVFRRSRLKRFTVCLSGIDGCGKSTQARKLAGYLRSLGLKVDVVWGRWPAFSSYLALGIGKVLGYNVKIREPSGQIRVVPHYHDLRPLGRLYQLLMLFDIHLWFVRVKIAHSQKNVIIFDRFILDALTDLAYETGEALGRHFGTLAYTYVACSNKLLDLSIVFDLDPIIAYERKVDVSPQELLAKKELFNAVASVSTAFRVDASSPPGQIAVQLERIFRESIELD